MAQCAPRDAPNQDPIRTQSTPNPHTISTQSAHNNLTISTQHIADSWGRGCRVRPASKYTYDVLDVAGSRNCRKSAQCWSPSRVHSGRPGHPGAALSAPARRSLHRPFYPFPRRALSVLSPPVRRNRGDSPLCRRLRNTRLGEPACARPVTKHTAGRASRGTLDSTHGWASQPWHASDRPAPRSRAAFPR